ncbi:MAG: hypothetical protein ACLFU9_06705 [Candidatus Bathyarchaeia archaeon]
MTDITEYLKQKIAEVRLARFIGEIVWASGFVIAVSGLFLRIFALTITGFSLLFLGLFLSVHYELQRLNYAHALEKLMQHEK